MDECKLGKMFALRKTFIDEIETAIPGTYPEYPMDMSKKESQQVCRDLTLKGVEEMFEALQHLKNWKPHRKSTVEHEINKDEFLEEVVDAYNYFFSMLIVAGFNEEELYEAFIKKDKIIRQRLNNGY